AGLFSAGPTGAPRRGARPLTDRVTGSARGARSGAKTLTRSGRSAGHRRRSLGRRLHGAAGPRGADGGDGDERDADARPPAGNLPEHDRADERGGGGLDAHQGAEGARVEAAEREQLERVRDDREEQREAEAGKEEDRGDVPVRLEEAERRGGDGGDGHRDGE